MNRSHSRHSFPFDKQLPVSESKGHDNITRRTIKKLHKKKQRQYNKRLVRDFINI